MQKNKRLAPSIFSSRYVALTRLRDATMKLIKELAAQEKPDLIDFGCGDMPYRSAILPYVNQYIGVDLAMNPLAQYHVDFDSKTDLPNACADIVLSNQVLEHVDNPQGYLQEAWRLLKPGGTLILSTHGYWYYHPTPYDYWRWTSAGLQRVIQENGFEIKEFTGLLGLAASGVQLFQDALINKTYRFLHYPLAFILQGLIALTDKLHSQDQRNKDAAIYVVFAKKAL